MAILEWSSRLQLDVPDMDAAHKRLIEMMGKLARLSESKASRAEVLGTFQALADATKKHFSEEEKYMESIAYAEIAQHRMIHVRLLEQLDHHLGRFKASTTSVIEPAVFDFLKVWLQAHIAGIDQGYADHAHRRAAAAR